MCYVITDNISNDLSLVACCNGDTIVNGPATDNTHSVKLTDKTADNASFMLTKSLHAYHYHVLYRYVTFQSLDSDFCMNHGHQGRI